MSTTEERVKHRVEYVAKAYGMKNVENIKHFDFSKVKVEGGYITGVASAMTALLNARPELFTSAKTMDRAGQAKALKDIKRIQADEHDAAQAARLESKYGITKNH
jgi:hypothetical protein